MIMSMCVGENKMEWNQFNSITRTLLLSDISPNFICAFDRFFEFIVLSGLAIEMVLNILWVSALLSFALVAVCRLFTVNGTWIYRRNFPLYLRRTVCNKCVSVCVRLLLHYFFAYVRMHISSKIVVCGETS